MAMKDLTLKSPVFTDGGEIPEKYGYTKQNINPPLEIRKVPEKAESLVLIMDDPDAKPVAGKVWEHWIVYNIPPETREIGEGELPEEAVEGRTDYDKNRYGGPNPPDKRHTYLFRLYAVDKELELGEGATKDKVLDAIEG
ncbi:MAG: YbhB/YbcL family Raf kinase inhibitor-like protein, partial [Candidatus Nanohaloarchaeota archaeon QJJ-9]|nr:YbhB/YbcL family Raf kinase inhibitor-like protein [Candidatus Nanohaloarchaeota archaeon QJJ-9]